mmetsp:Transcript_15299/g.31028  ORF Transcript_15299/g.31028 Transcript_15299/m.31028 type:complete len:201 (-) Transcript_15299:23-625(-)
MVVVRHRRSHLQSGVHRKKERDGSVWRVLLHVFQNQTARDIVRRDAILVTRSFHNPCVLGLGFSDSTPTRHHLLEKTISRFLVVLSKACRQALVVSLDVSITREVHSRKPLHHLVDQAQLSKIFYDGIENVTTLVNNPSLFHSREQLFDLCRAVYFGEVFNEGQEATCRCSSRIHCHVNPTLRPLRVARVAETPHHHLVE